MSNMHDGGRGVSPQLGSNSDLSSPPRSSPEMDDIQNRNDSSSITVNHSALDASTSEKPTRKKPVRKPRPKAGDISSATNTDAPKAKRARKPRDPNAPPARSRKKPAASETTNGSESSRQTKITESPGMRLSESNFSLPPTPPVQNATITQKGETEAIPRSFFNSAPLPTQAQTQQPQVVPPPPPPPPPPAPAQPQPQMAPQPRTSGQNYDPIRSNYDPVRETLVSHNSYNTNSQGSPIPPPTTNRASASPSISSLVDPPNQPLTSPSAHSFLMHQQQVKRQREDGHTSVPASPTVNRLGPSAILDPTSPRSFTQTPTMSSQTLSGPPPPSAPITQSLKPAQNSNGDKKKQGTNGASVTSSPKPPPKQKERELLTPPPLPGSGLMQFGGPNDGTESRAPTIVLDIPLHEGEVNKYVNFARMAEEAYGWDALHPRLAAQRDRLARVAAAGAALERNGSSKESGDGDEMSLDSEGEGSNVEMGGTGTDGGAKKAATKKRKTKEDEYDRDDGFVDDSDLMWEEQAAAANDGFFVYSGPLVPEGEKPALDRYVTRDLEIHCMHLTITLGLTVKSRSPVVGPQRLQKVVQLRVEAPLAKPTPLVAVLALVVEVLLVSLESLKLIEPGWNKRRLSARRWAL
ncbi:HIR complex subunit [Clarireedia jacksonii]